MLPFKLVYSDDYYLPIGAHVFPAQKYRLIHKRLLETGLAEASDFVTPQSASDQDILLIAIAGLIRGITAGALWDPHETTVAELSRRIGLNLLGGRGLAVAGADNSLPIRADLGSPWSGRPMLCRPPGHQPQSVRPDNPIVWPGKDPAGEVSSNSSPRSRWTPSYGRARAASLASRTRPCG